MIELRSENAEDDKRPDFDADDIVNQLSRLNQTFSYPAFGIMCLWVIMLFFAMTLSTIWSTLIMAAFVFINLAILHSRMNLALHLLTILVLEIKSKKSK